MRSETFLSGGRRPLGRAHVHLHSRPAGRRPNRSIPNTAPRCRWRLWRVSDQQRVQSTSSPAISRAGGEGPHGGPITSLSA